MNVLWNKHYCWPENSALKNFLPAQEKNNRSKCPYFIIVGVKCIVIRLHDIILKEMEWKITFLAAHLSCAKWRRFWCNFRISYASFKEQHDKGDQDPFKICLAWMMRCGRHSVYIPAWICVSWVWKKRKQLLDTRSFSLIAEAAVSSALSWWAVSGQALISFARS